tara:strand:- start:729 stop:887 length:159 start_codon:yes stop_codon:yes gene_type:complete
MYTVWVGGTEVTDNYVTFEDASMLHNYYKERGHDDIIVQFEEVPVVGQWQDY